MVLFLALASAYSVITPIGRGADEWAHYWYAQFIAQNGRLPLNPAERETAGYKSDWPPLYHLCVAAVTAWIDTAGPPTFKFRADPNHLHRQIIPAPPSEAILHTEDELFPWQQEILVWHLGRFLSIGFSLGTLLVTYRLALEVFTGSKVAGSRVAGSRNIENFASRFLSPQILALACVAFLAFIPRFLFTGMLFNYDSLTLLVASLFLWLAVRVAKGYYPRWGFWALGGLAGLALLTKYLTALLPLEIVFLAFNRNAGAPGRSEEFIPSPLLKLGQALLAFLLVTGGWFGYLLVNFNEIETYGPVLGTLAPLLRGDGSDRTVEQIFAAISGGQAPPPAHIDRQHYSAGQLISEFFITFWTNPVTRPSPLNWFVLTMTGVTIMAVIGLLKRPRGPSLPGFAASPPRRLVSLLLLHCFLPLPFMLIRLFGARDALEAVQGRHILFLAGPAVAILLVLGISRFTFQVSGFTFHAPRLTLYALTGLLLTGAMLQFITLGSGYPSPLPVRTTPFAIGQAASLSPLATLPNGAKVLRATVMISDEGPWFSHLFTVGSPAASLVTFFWQGGRAPAPEDYQVELTLVDRAGQTRVSWLAFQTQARYPTRAWEAGDTIRDEGWLPLERLEPGEYTVRWRILGEAGPVVDWQTLSTYTLTEPARQQDRGVGGWSLWRDGQVTSVPPTLRERETAQFTFADRRPPTADRHLIGSDGVLRSPVSRGEDWANFIIGPDWPPGDYRWQPEGEVVLRIENNERNFQTPALPHPLAANFAGQVKLLGYDLPVRRVQPGEGLPVTLYWQGLRWMGEDFVIFNRLLDNQGMAWGGYDRRAKENYSTLFWAPGEVITDGFAVPVDAAAPPGIYTLNVGWYRRVGGQADSLAILDPQTGQPGGSTAVTIGPVKVGGPPPGVTVTAAAPKYKIDVTLGEQIKLLGFDLMSRQASEPTKSVPNLPTFQPSDSLHLALYWQALAIPATDYTVFAHLRNAAGETVAQKDGLPAGGVYPTGLWEAGEIIKDEVTIPLDTLAPGSYQLAVGMYNLATGARLPVPGSPDNAILLGLFEAGK
ncbi:MAG: glycosyltransferase family 39 protein [Anaerolineales bacterium]|nr:glycosyltransferase family 39 protein [Anaerolineales bacterium]